MEFSVGRTDALFHSKLVEIRSVRGIQLPAAVVLCVLVVIGNAFSTEIIAGALHESGNFLRSSMIHAVLEWLSPMCFQFSGRASAKIKTAGENQAHLQKKTKFFFMLDCQCFKFGCFQLWTTVQAMQ